MDRNGSAHCGLGDLLEESDRKERANLSLKTFNILLQAGILFPESHEFFADALRGAIDKFVESARQLRRFHGWLRGIRRLAHLFNVRFWLLLLS